MYVVALHGEHEQIVDLAGLYRLVARINPLDDAPMSLDASAVTNQMTCPREDCLLPVSTREALHSLVWGAAAGKVTTHRFVDGPVVALRVLPGSEYKQPPKEYGEVRKGSPAVAPGGSRSGSGRRSIGVDDHGRRFGVGGRR